MQIQYAISSGPLCSCTRSEVYEITNLNNPNDKLIVKIFPNVNDIYNKERAIYNRIENLPNTQNILKGRHNDIGLLLGNEFGANAVYLHYNYLNHDNLYEYLRHSSQFTEDMVKFVGKKLFIAVRSLHENNITHNSLDTNYIMMNNDFHPFIIHFKDANINGNNADNYDRDYLGLAKILVKMITNGRFYKLDYQKFNNVWDYCMVDEIGKAHRLDNKFWDYHFKNSISQEFRSFFKLLISSNNLNINNFLTNQWFDGIDNNLEIEGLTRQHFTKIYGLIQDQKQGQEEFNNECFDMSNIGTTDEEDFENFSLMNNVYSQPRSDSPKTNLDSFKELIIRTIKYKPTGNVYEYLRFEVSNYDLNSIFFAKLMSDLYKDIEKSDLKNFNIGKESLEKKETSDLSFDVFVELIDDNDNLNEDEKDDMYKIIPKKKVEEFKENEQALTINLEIAEYKGEKNENNYKGIFYLLFTYKQGEISFYYLFVKLFKEKARLLLKNYLKKK